jgi:membrane protein DedA with SNARE-associated domain
LVDILGLLDQITETLTSLITDSPWTYLLILGLAALDVILPIIPSEASVLIAAVLAGTGHLNIVLIMVAAALGAFIGDNVAYWIGRTAGRPLIERLLGGRWDRLAWVEGQLETRGGSLIVTGRFIPGGRSVVAIGAGVLHMPWPRFAAWDALAAVIWAIQAALPGFIGGAAFEERPWLGLLFGVVISVSLVVGIEAIRWWRRRRAGLAAGPPPPEEDAVARALSRMAARREHGELDDEPAGPSPAS